MGLQFENLTECLLKKYHTENTNRLLKTLRKEVHVKEGGLGKVTGQVSGGLILERQILNEGG